ncbi:hypothetical protein BLNAU_10450 [Blattamonas nauphoetae]|uniref:Uncharacterized protein n=1 Tax=Blattamonas nauphoetae TaxID=2049346 RepID=A0ABQ9XS12_9EUKA|nr:hypothetical protein BLNAU_10450 [Blattamonas nauphoetae]
MKHQTIESVLEWLNDSSVNPGNKVNSVQWSHIPTLLENYIQSKNQQNSEQLSQLLQRMMRILDECIDSNIPIPNKRLLHSSLSQLSQTPSLNPKIKREAKHCLVSLEDHNEGQLVPNENETLDSVEGSKDGTITDRRKQRAHRPELVLSKEETQSLSDLQQKQSEVLGTLNEIKKRIKKLKRINLILALLLSIFIIGVSYHQPIKKMMKEVTARFRPIDASDVIVAFSPDSYRMNGSTVTRINSNSWAGCFTKPVSKGIHRLSIKTEGDFVMFGVLDAAEYPDYLTSSVSYSPKAAMMWSDEGTLWSANKQIAQNTRPEKGQELSAEADLGKRTLHFFVDGVQQQHFFIDIPVPLVFAIDARTYSKDVPIEITADETTITADAIDSSVNDGTFRDGSEPVPLSINVPSSQTDQALTETAVGQSQFPIGRERRGTTLDVGPVFGRLKVETRSASPLSSLLLPVTHLPSIDMILPDYSFLPWISKDLSIA